MSNADWETVQCNPRDPRELIEAAMVMACAREHLENTDDPGDVKNILTQVVLEWVLGIDNDATRRMHYVIGAYRDELRKQGVVLVTAPGRPGERN